ncbi:hypothetical protein EMPG_13184 [Blastomyces silverae]|uniref:Uncharacterized protein n=1 Tax=Blastomyces silverae TaxID=2060906 RepID=A0A0H1BJE3_9EURO|nr:hypothetical protein EMPG_13184 [Blastomyces silverae]
MAFRQIIIGGKSVIIAIKEMVVTKTSGFYRPVHALDQQFVEETLRRAEVALHNPGVIPTAVMDKLCKVEIESLDHSSELDPNMHSTGVLKDENGGKLGKIHITTDPSLQQPARIDTSST